MELNVKERLALLQMIPQIQGNLATLRILSDLARNLGFTESEHADLKFKQTAGKLEWRGSLDRDIDIGPVALKAVQKHLQALDRKGKLTMDHLSLCDKFMED